MYFNYFCVFEIGNTPTFHAFHPSISRQPCVGPSIPPADFFAIYLRPLPLDTAKEHPSNTQYIYCREFPLPERRGVEGTFQFRLCYGSKKDSRVHGKYTNFNQMSLFHIYIFGVCFEKCRNQSRNRNTLCIRSLHSGLVSAKNHPKRRVACRNQSNNKNAPYSLPQQTMIFGFRICIFPLWTRKCKFIR